MILNYSILLLASGLEIAWAVGLKYADSLPDWIATVLCILGSFRGLVLASKRMPPALAYILFVIFGTVGSYGVDIYFFGKEFSFIAILAIAAMLICVAMLHRER